MSTIPMNAPERAERWLELARESLAVEAPATDFGRFGLGTGEELFRSGVSVTKLVRAGLAKLRATCTNSFAEGYLSAVADVISGFELGLRRQQSDLAQARTNAPGTIQDKTLSVLALTGLRRSSDLANDLKLAPYEMSRVLGRLRDEGLVDVETGSNARERLYTVTPRGRALFEQGRAALQTSIRERWDIAYRTVLDGWDSTCALHGQSLPADLSRAWREVLSQSRAARDSVEALCVVMDKSAADKSSDTDANVAVAACPASWSA
jgi:DNA-binding MarR family transcriptional regulator